MKKTAVVVLLFAFVATSGFLFSPSANAGSTDDLVSALCSKMASCAEGKAKLRKQVGKKQSECVDKLSASTGMLLWDNFGLAGQENKVKAGDVEAMITKGDVIVQQDNLSQCVKEIATLECGVVEEHVSKGLTETQYIISTQGACPNVYTAGVAPTTTAGQLIDSICNAYTNCQKGTFDPSLTRNACIAELNGAAGKALWDEFGLKKKFRDRFTAAQIEREIDAKAIKVDAEALNECRQEQIPQIACEDFARYVAADNWNNIDKALGKSAPCKDTLSSTKHLR